MKRLAVLALAAALWGCADSPLQPETPAPPTPRAVLSDPCTSGPYQTIQSDTCDTGGGTGGGTGGSYWNYFAPYGDSPYEAQGDPNPWYSGIYLGWVTPGACFSDQNRGAIAYDADLDWLDDRCELELARAFAPSLKFTASDACPNGEPYWAAKYFPSRGMVRIAYLPAYYRDCGADKTYGYDTGHSGDSEFISVEVVFNAATQHWQFLRMFLSAHYGEVTDRSAWRTFGEVEYTWRSRAHPTVWVSEGKHANYHTRSYCDTLVETCGPFYSSLAMRFPVDPAHNLGSRFVHFKDQVYSEKPEASGAGPLRSEWFWTAHNFRGWQMTIYGDSPKAYSEWLMGQQFEYYFEGVMVPDGGPGPDAPPRSPSGPMF